MSRPAQARRGALLLALYVMLFALLVSITIVVFIARAPPAEPAGRVGLRTSCGAPCVAAGVAFAGGRPAAREPTLLARGVLSSS